MNFSVTDEQSILSLGTKIVDCVSWTNGDGKISKDEQKDIKKLIKQGAWRGVSDENSCVKLAKKWQSIGRKKTDRDNDNKSDWSIQIKPTHGRKNEAVTVKNNVVLRITALDPNGSPDWAEITCIKGSVDISSFQLTDIDGTDQRLSDKPFTLKKGEKAKVWWKPGITENDAIGDKNGNGIRDIYLKDNQLAGTDDQLVLILDNKIYDAVIWTNSDGSMAKQEIKDCKFLVTQGEWNGSYSAFTDQKDSVNVGLYRRPIRRKDINKDTNSKSDWESY